MLLIEYKKWDVASAESDVHVLMLPVNKYKAFACETQPLTGGVRKI